MSCPAFTGFGLPELVTLRSAWVELATPIVTVAELLVRLVSRLVVATVAVSVMMVPAVVPAFTFTTNVNVLVEFGATVGSEQLIAPDVVQVHPADPENELKVVFVGMGSVKVAVEQLLGPLFVTVCV